MKDLPIETVFFTGLTITAVTLILAITAVSLTKSDQARAMELCTNSSSEQTRVECAKAIYGVEND